MLNTLYDWLYPPAPWNESPEFRALLYTSQRAISGSQSAGLQTLLSASFNWDRFIDLALNHKVHSLVYWNLNTTFRDYVPADKLETLQSHFSSTVMSNLRAKAELARILDAFRNTGIRVMPVRGLTLAYLLYGGIWLREFKDIDLLVKEVDFPQAEQMILDLGYVRTMDIEDNAYNQKLFNESLGIEVELHWALDAPLVPVAIAPDYYWNRSGLVSLEGLEVESLPLTDLLMTLCFHGAKHRWSRLKWLCDVNELVRLLSPEDWNVVMSEARSMHVERILSVNLWLVQSLFDTVLPASVTEALGRSHLVKSLGHYSRGWLSQQDETSVRDQIRGMSFFVLIHENSRERIPALIHGIQYPKSQVAQSITAWPPIRVLRSLIFRSSRTSTL